MDVIFPPIRLHLIPSAALSSAVVWKSQFVSKVLSICQIEWKRSIYREGRDGERERERESESRKQWENKSVHRSERLNVKANWLRTFFMPLLLTDAHLHRSIFNVLLPFTGTAAAWTRVGFLVVGEHNLCFGSHLIALLLQLAIKTFHTIIINRTLKPTYRHLAQRDTRTHIKYSNRILARHLSGLHTILKDKRTLISPITVQLQFVCNHKFFLWMMRTLHKPTHTHTHPFWFSDCMDLVEMCARSMW